MARARFRRGGFSRSVSLVYDWADRHNHDRPKGDPPAMALTPSTMLDLGTKAPDFRLADTEGKTVSLDDFRGAPALLVVFLCNHCPYVKHVRHELARLGRDYQARGVAVVGISSNDVAA